MNFDYKALIDKVLSKNFWPRILIMVFGALLLAINYNLFLFPNSLVTGGTSGIATILYHVFEITPATFIFICNIVLVILSFILLGPRNTGFTIVGSILYPLFVSLTEPICSMLSSKLVIDNFMMTALISGFMLGTGNGFIYKAGFTTGGSDIMIQILCKYVKIPNGISSFIINIIIIGAGGIFFGINKVLYATLIIIINSMLIDKIMLGISDSKMFYISTKKPDAIKKFISEMNTGYTLLKTEGGYSKEDNELIMCVIRTSDYYMFKNVVEEIDPHAFFIISDCYEVYGGHHKQKFPFI